MTTVNKLYTLAQLDGLNDERILQESLVLVACLLEKNSKTHEDLCWNSERWIERLRSMTSRRTQGGGAAK